MKDSVRLYECMCKCACVHMDVTPMRVWSSGNCDTHSRTLTHSRLVGWETRARAGDCLTSHSENVF